MRSPLRRFALLVALIGAFGVGGGDRAEAAAVPGAGYAGVTSDLGRVTLDVSADGSRINTLTLSYPATSIRTGCPASATLTDITITPAHAASVNAGSATFGQTVTFTAIFASDGTVTGTFSASGGGASCTARNNVLLAATPIPTTTRNPNAGSTYRGATSLGGEVTFNVGSDRRSITSGTLVLDIEGCDYGGPLTNPVNNVVTTGSFDVAVNVAGASAFHTVGTFSGTTATGSFVAIEGDPGCPNAVATFSLTGTGGAPPGFIPATPAFSPEGLAQVAFTGGSVSDLEAAAIAVGAKGVWVQDAVGGFQLLVIGGPAFLRADFNSKFPSGFETKAMTLTR